jgi:NodT family efflux transporter outer membrane factor (OMF) lipoprotein
MRDTLDQVRITPRAHRAAWLVIMAAVAMTGASSCAVGPDYVPPPAPETTRYTPEPLDPKVGAAPQPPARSQLFAEGQDIPASWWTLYQCEALNRLVGDALAANPSLEAAKAALRQARENVLSQEGALFPQLTANFSSTREKSSGAAFGLPGFNSLFSVSTGELNVSYPLDVFGGTRRTVESFEAAEDYQRFELAAAYLTLTSNVVTAAIQEASLRAQIAATQQIVDIDANILKVLRDQLQLGGIAAGAVLAQEATLAQARAMLPPLQKQLAQQRNQLAVLSGRPPSDDIGATFQLDQMSLPLTIPVSLPSQLVARRPDIRAAESTLHQANAQIGVAIANELPQFTLTGTFGSAGAPAGAVFGPGTELWSIGGSFAQKLFDGGTLLHAQRAAVAAHDQAAAQYRNTVLSAFQDVANALRALQSDADALAADVAADQAAARSLALSREQFKAGAITFTTLQNAEQTSLQTHVTLVQAEAARYADTAALFQALGGGWWNDTSGALAPVRAVSDASADLAKADAAKTDPSTPDPAVSN